MKQIMLVLLLVAAVGLTAQTKGKSKTETVTIACNIDCANCVRSIEKNIPFEKGVRNVKVDAKNQKVQVTYNTTQTDTTKLKAAFEKIGKVPTVVAQK